jgi:hypothetical protein
MQVPQVKEIKNSPGMVEPHDGIVGQLRRRLLESKRAPLSQVPKLVRVAAEHTLLLRRVRSKPHNVRMEVVVSSRQLQLE